MSESNYIQTIPDSQVYTDIDQLIETIKTLEFKVNNSILIEDEIHYILVGLQNSKKQGFNLKRTQDGNLPSP
jgi:hypothetical protein